MIQAQFYRHTGIQEMRFEELQPWLFELYDRGWIPYTIRVTVEPIPGYTEVGLDIHRTPPHTRYLARVTGYRPKNKLPGAMLVHLISIVTDLAPPRGPVRNDPKKLNEALKAVQQREGT